MNISTRAIVSNSEMIKNYKACRDKAESLGKIFILKNNQPDAVLFSISEYQRLAAFIEYFENLEEKEKSNLIEALPNKEVCKIDPIDLFRNDNDKDDGR